MPNDDDNRGLVFRRSQSSSTSLVPPRHQGADLVQETRHGDGSMSRTVLPGSDATIYQQMLEEAVRLEDLANQLNRLKSRDVDTRRLIRTLRVMAVDLREEVERRING